MAHEAKIICDSLSPRDVRLTTFEITFPRIVLAEFNTHRMLTRNSASSRAIPVKRMIEMVMTEPYMPTHWGKNQKGMSADEEVSELEQEKARSIWRTARDLAVTSVETLDSIGIHKQITNRLLEPFLWHTVVTTGTEWSNFFHLRDHPAAHPEIQKIARMMRVLYENSAPKELEYGEWHLPYIDQETAQHLFDLSAGDIKEYWATAKKISTARCAAVSYMRQDGKDIPGQFGIYDKLLTSGHMSPFEHPATPIHMPDTPAGKHQRAVANMDRKNNFWAGNFKDWFQHRKEIPFEDDALGAPSGGHSLWSYDR